MGGVDKGELSIYTPLLTRIWTRVTQAPKELHYVYDFVVIIKTRELTGTFISTARFICFNIKDRTYTILSLLQSGTYPYMRLQALCPAYEKAVIN